MNGPKKYQEYLDKTKFCHTELDFIKRYGEIEGKSRWEKYRKSCARTEEFFVNKYGKDEGLKRWNEYRRKQSVTNTFEYKEKVYGWSKEQFDEYNKSRAVTLKNLVKKYGEDEGQIRWDNYCKRQAYTCSIEYYIEKYGEEQGKIEFNKMLESKVVRPSGNFYSKESQILFDKIAAANKHNHILYFGENERLIKIGKTHALLDFFNETTNKAIEFYGDYWHRKSYKIYWN